jgi:hypothetical protein
MHAILFLVVLVMAAPLVLYASPVIVYLVPFILLGLALSFFADHVRHEASTARH